MQEIKLLLKTEWLKLKNYLPFKLIALFFCAGIFIANYITYSFNKNIVDNVSMGSMLGTGNMYSFYNTWHTTSYTSGWLLLLPAMLMVILITNEFTYRTSRQNIIDGWSRQQAFKVKIALALIFALVSTVIVMITAAIFGLVTGNEFSLNEFYFLGFFFLKAISYNIIAIFISFWIRRTGFAIGVFFIYMGAENFLAQILDFWSLDLKKSSDLDLGSLGDYLPMNSSDALLTVPSNALKDLSNAIMPGYYPLIVGTLAIGYLTLFTWLSYRNAVNRDF